MNTTSPKPTPLPGRVDLSRTPRLSMLMEMVSALSLASAPQQVLDAVVAAVRQAYGPRAYLTLSTRGLEPGQFRITRWVSPDGRQRIWTYDTHGSSEPVHDAGLLASIVAGSDPVLLHDLNLSSDPVLGDRVTGLRSLAAAPILEHGRAVSWTVLLHEDPRGLGVADLEQLILRGNLLGPTAAGAVVGKRLREATDWIQHDVEHLAAIQRSLLPQSTPEIPGLKVATWHDAYDLAGGDYYDLVPLTLGLGGKHAEASRPWGIMIADAAGHGMDASVIVALLHSVLHASDEATGSPEKLLAQMNQRLFARRRGGGFVTAFYGVYDPTTRTLRYANAGHNPPLLRRADGGVSSVEEGGGLPLGVTDEYSVEPASVTLEPGQSLLLYTDGLTDASNPQGEAFGVQRVEAVLGSAGPNPTRVVELMDQTLKRHEAGTEAIDDRAMIVLSVETDEFVK